MPEGIGSRIARARAFVESLNLEMKVERLTKENKEKEVLLRRAGPSLRLAAMHGDAEAKRLSKEIDDLIGVTIWID